MTDSHLNQTPIIKHLSAATGTAGVLAFHGRNGTPEGMEALMSELQFDAHAYVLPRAANKTWYPDKFMAPLEVNKPQLDIALENAKNYHQQLNESGVKDEDLIIMGFSQGACLAAQYALMNPAKYKAIIILTGGYIGPQGIDWGFSGDFDSTPVYLTTSEIDEWVPPSRAKETAEAFQKLNAQVNYQLFNDRTHHIPEEEKEYIRNTF